MDVNLVGEEVLLEILKKGGLPEEEAEGVRDAILDWRDEDDVPRPRGAERAEYERMTEPIMPRNGKIQGIGELMYVKGVTKEFYDAFLSRVFTAHGDSAQLNFPRAPEIVLRSLPGVSAEAADRIVAGRKEERPLPPPTWRGWRARDFLPRRGWPSFPADPRRTSTRSPPSGGRKKTLPASCGAWWK